MITSTTPTLQGMTITEYLGLVTGEAILGAIVGGRSQAYEQELHRAQEIAISEMTADAVVGIDIDCETIGANGSMLMVGVSGTGVTID